MLFTGYLRSMVVVSAEKSQLNSPFAVASPLGRPQSSIFTFTATISPFSSRHPHMSKEARKILEETKADDKKMQGAAETMAQW
jgi:hypothetical protein